MLKSSASVDVKFVVNIVCDSPFCDLRDILHAKIHCVKKLLAEKLTAALTAEYNLTVRLKFAVNRGHVSCQ